jgi:hypothetical protein
MASKSTHGARAEVWALRVNFSRTEFSQVRCGYFLGNFLLVTLFVTRGSREMAATVDNRKPVMFRPLSYYPQPELVIVVREYNHIW